MDKHIEDIILKNTQAKAIVKTEIIQSLWSGYGQIMRCALKGSPYKNIVAKHIKGPNANNHPRG